MAHNLTINGKTVEMAYAGETPWHGLGNALPALATVEEMQRAAGLFWTVRKAPMFDERGIVVPGFQAVARDDNNVVLGVVSNQYHIIQNAQAFETLDALIAEGAATVETAGSLGDGFRVWALSKVPGDFRVIGEDAVNAYFLLDWRHDGNGGLSGRLTPIRVVCQNTLSAATGGRAAFSIRHAANAKLRIEEAHRALGIVRHRMEETTEAYRALAAKPVTESVAKSYFASLFQPKAQGEEETVESFIRRMETFDGQQDELLALFESGAGAEYGRGNAWGAYNAVTEWVDHRYPVLQNGKVSDTRQESALFGTYAKVKQDALDVALAL